MNKERRIGVSVTEEMKDKLEKTSKKTGLGQSEIVRRGLLEQIRELEG